MRSTSLPCLGLALGFLVTAGIAPAQSQDGAAPVRADDSRLLLRYATFDPIVNQPEVPFALQSGVDTNLWIVQFQSSPTDADRARLRELGCVVHGYLPHDAHVVRMDGAQAAAAMQVEGVRWVGAYQPAYRLEAFLLAEQLAGGPVPVRTYNMVMADKRRDKQALEAKVRGIGGKVVDRHINGLLFTAELTGAQLAAAARFDEVLWIDRWAAPEFDMNNARIQGGANTIENAAGYTGSGVRGHLYEGAEFDHPDFNTNLTNVRSGGQADAHGHCTAGIIFGNGNSAPEARGMAPNAVGFYTNSGTVTAGWSRNMVIDDVVNVHQCMFTTASWGSGLTSAYTSVSADSDDIVFDHRIPWTNSMSNQGTTQVRPEAWAKNVISVGGVDHNNNSLASDDSWLAGGASIGPAADTRSKPDLAAYYENVWTSDLSGTAGYSSGNSTTGFNGTSAATPIIAGHNALAVQMFTDSIFSNPPRVVGGSRFQNRPYAQTLKALMIVGANLYTPSATDNRREHVGWGFPSLSNLYNRRDRITIIPENAPITQGSTHTYEVEVLPGETLLKVCMTYLDPAGNPAASFDRINDLTMRAISPSGAIYYGNWGLVGASQGNLSLPGGSANTRDTVECVVRTSPTVGVWTIEVSAPTLTVDAHTATGATDATYALVVNGARRIFGSDCARYIPDNSASSSGPNNFPWGGYAFSGLETTFASNTSLGGNGTVYFDVTVSDAMYITALDVHTAAAAGTDVFIDVWRTNAGVSYSGNETSPVWLAMTAGRGVSAGSGVHTPMELSEPFLLTPGVYGFAVQAGNFNWSYTTGTGANQNYNNTNVAISTGSSKLGAPGTAGTVFSPRVANVELQYRLDSALGTNIRYQTIVRRNELGTAGAITGLSFASDVSGRHWNSSLLVRMSHVPAGHDLVSTFATNLPSPVTVLSGSNYSFQHAAESWRELGLQNAFNYNGTSDVVIDIVARGNVQWTTGAFHDGGEPRVYDAAWTGFVPTTGTVDVDQALRMRVMFNCAAANEHGSSCGRLRASHVGDGRRGANFTFRLLDGPPNLFAVVSLGVSNTAPLPLSLSPFGWTNCLAFNDPVLTITATTDANGTGNYVLAVPNNASLDGAYVFGQWFTFDTAEPGTLTFSNHTRMLVGLTP